MKRALILLAPAVLALGLVACGGDDDDDSPDTTEASTEETTEATTSGTEGGEASESGGDAEDEAVEMVSEIYPSLSEEQVRCLVEQTSDVSEMADQAAAMELFEACDIDLSDLADVDLGAISVPDLGSLPQEAIDAVADMFPGLSEEQVNCIIDAFGGDFDLSQAAELTETCDIDPADLQPGG